MKVLDSKLEGSNLTPGFCRANGFTPGSEKVKALTKGWLLSVARDAKVSESTPCSVKRR